MIEPEMPLTTKLTFSEIQTGLRKMMPSVFQGELKVSMSQLPSVAEAVEKFGRRKGLKLITVVNQADGSQPGCGYLQGHEGPEEDLCRRFPMLHASLQAAEGDNLYPFGPPTSRSGDPSGYSDVLYTGHVAMKRGAEVAGFPIWEKSKCFNCSVVSAAPPRADGTDIERGELFSNSLLSIFAAPLVRGVKEHTNPDVTEIHEAPPIVKSTVLIVGAWGFGNNHAEVSKLYANLLSGEGANPRICIGNVYREIHFCFPSGSVGERYKKSLRTQLQSKEIYPSEET